MDYNDINSRLKRTLHSLDERNDDDYRKHENIEHWKNGKGFSLTWGEENEDVLINKIMIILHNLSSLKDHVKNRLNGLGINSSLVENEINNSLHLQVLVDIINQEKHGTPLNRPRSNVNPKITDPTQGLRMAGGKTEDENGFSPTIFIDAIIRKENGEILFYLGELVETCYAKWIAILKEYDPNFSEYSN